MVRLFKGFVNPSADLLCNCKGIMQDEPLFSSTVLCERLSTILKNIENGF